LAAAFGRDGARAQGSLPNPLQAKHSFDAVQYLQA
jgi:hypothetical protein